MDDGCSRHRMGAGKALLSSAGISSCIVQEDSAGFVRRKPTYQVWIVLYTNIGKRVWSPACVSGFLASTVQEEQNDQRNYTRGPSRIVAPPLATQSFGAYSWQGESYNEPLNDAMLVAATETVFAVEGQDGART